MFRRPAPSTGSHLVAFATTLLALAASPALAGPVDPVRHAFERVGATSAPASIAVQVPSTNRVLVFAEDGDVRLVTGGGLLSTSIGSLPVDASCGGATVYGAAWDPAAPETDLLVTYRAAGTRSLTLGRVRLAADLGAFAFEPLFETGAPTSCQRVGGGLAVAADGTVLIGVGDHGDPAAAASIASPAGTILRVTTEGLPPAAPLEINPLGPSSPLLATGVRDPVAIATDRATGESWFLDRGPADGADELNLVGRLTNHGWSSARLSGHQDLAGDPHHVWDPPVGVSGMLAPGEGALGGTADARLVVTSTGTGVITSVVPDPADPFGSTEDPLFEPDPTGPQTFVDPRAYADGVLHVVADGAQIWRLRPRRSALAEPSRRISVLPATLRKAAAGSYVLGAERVGLGASFGVHVGDLTLLSEAYDHPDSPDLVLGPATEDGDALTRWTLSDDDLGGAGSSVYVLIGAFDACAATGLGVDSVERSRPGGGDSAGGGVPVLGNGSHDLADVTVTEVVSGADGLNLPRDLEFHPDVQGQLWIVNRQDDSTVIVHDAGRPTQSSEWKAGPGGNHFLAQPSALAFGPGTAYLATAHEEDEQTQGPSGTPADFMGPTLWTNDATEYEGGHASHYDMLHNSPNGAGIAWESGTAYWVFDGWHASLTRYDFQADHGPGGADHTDGIIDRYAEGLVTYEPDVPSHLVWDHETDELLVADTGNDRIAVFDPSTATASGSIGPNYDGCTMNGMAGGTLTTLIDGSDHGLVSPSGLELDGCRLYVSDNATSTIYAFTRDGLLLDWLVTGWPAGTLMGMAIDPRDGDLYVVDALTDRVLRLSPR